MSLTEYSCDWSSRFRNLCNCLNIGIGLWEWTCRCSFRCHDVRSRWSRSLHFWRSSAIRWFGTACSFLNPKRGKSWSKPNYKIDNDKSHTPMVAVGPCTDHYTSFSFGFDFIFDGTGLNCFFLGDSLTGGSDVPKNINCHFFNSPAQIVRLFIERNSSTITAVCISVKTRPPLPQ